MKTVKVIFNGVADRRPGREGQFMMKIMRDYDPHLKLHYVALKDKVIEAELSEKHVEELNADYPGAFTIVTEAPVKKKASSRKSPGRPKGSKNKRRKRPKKRKAKKQPSSSATESATS